MQRGLHQVSLPDQRFGELRCAGELVHAGVFLAAVAAVHARGHDEPLQAMQAEMVVVAAAVGYGQTAFQPGRRAGCAEALCGQSLRVCLESLAKYFGRKSGRAAEMSGCLPDGFFDFRQLLQHQRMVKPTHLAGQYTRFRYNIVRRSARNRTDVDGQIANPAAVDARDGFGHRLDCMQSFLGRECSMGSASGKFRT